MDMDYEKHSYYVLTKYEIECFLGKIPKWMKQSKEKSNIYTIYAGYTILLLYTKSYSFYK